jgi:CHAD domain-containing protein
LLHRYYYKNPGLAADDLTARIPHLGIEVSERGSGESSFTYYDTQSGRVYRDGFRLRFQGGKGEWSLEEGVGRGGWVEKAEGPAGGSSGVEAFGTGRAAPAPPGEGPVGRRLRRVLGGRRLVPVLEAEVREERRAVSSPGMGEALLTFQTWRFARPYNGGPAAAALILVESATVPEARGGGKRGARRAGSSESTVREPVSLSILLRDIFGGLKPSADPLVLGLEALGLPLPGAPVPEKYSVAGEDAFPTAILKVLGAQAYKMRANLEGTLRDLDPGFLHDLRVAARRARLALKHARRGLDRGRCEFLRGELAWAAELFGGVRDLDVFTADMDEQFARVEAPAGAREAVMGALGARRVRGFASLSEALGSTRFVSLLSEIDAFRFIERRGAEREAAEKEGGRITYASAAVQEAARDLIGDALGKVKKRGGGLGRGKKLRGGDVTPAELHSLRIAFKELRYTCEFFAPLFGGGMKQTIRSLVKFQDCLGRHQDARVAAGILGGLVAEPAMPPEALVALGSLIQLHRERAIGERRALLTLWPGFASVAEELRSQIGR